MYGIDHFSFLFVSATETNCFCTSVAGIIIRYLTDCPNGLSDEVGGKDLKSTQAYPGRLGLEEGALIFKGSIA